MKRLLLLALVCLCAVSAHAQSSFTVPVTNTAGNAIAGATVTYTCLSGGCGSNSYVAITDRNGNAQFSNVAAGRYTVTTAGPGISLSSYTQDVPCAGSSCNPSSLNGIIFVDGVTYKTLAAAVAVCPNPGRVIVPPGLASSVLTISSNLTIPTTCTLDVYQGANLSIATAVTLNIQGNLIAGRYQIFTLNGSGVVTFGNGSNLQSLNRSVYPEWWGAKGDALTDDTAALQAAWNATKLGNGSQDATRANGGLILSLGCTTYAVESSGGLNFTNVSNYTIDGCTQFQSQIAFVESGSVGIDLSGGSFGRVNNVQFSCLNGSFHPTVCALMARTNTGSSSNTIQNKFDHVFVWTVGSYGFYGYRNEQFSCDDCDFEEESTTGIPWVISAANTAGVTSPNVTFGGTNSCTVFQFFGGAATIGSTSTTASQPLLLLDEGSGSAVQGITIAAFFNSKGSNNNFIGDTSGATGTISNVDLNIHGNGASTTSNVLLKITGTALSWRIRGEYDSPGTSGGPALSFTTIQTSYVQFQSNILNGFSASTSAVGSTIIMDSFATVSAPKAALILGSSSGSELQTFLVLANQGTALSNGAISLGAGWGTSAAPTVCTGPGWTNTGCFTITSGNASFSAAPTVTITLPNALPSANTPCTLDVHAITGTGGSIIFDETTFSATAPVFTATTSTGAAFTPAVTETYKVVLRCGP